MIIQGYKPQVNFFHYDTKEDFEEYETDINVHFSPLKIANDDEENNSSRIGVRLDFRVVLSESIISGSLGLITLLKGQSIESQEDLTDEEQGELLIPLFQLVERMTYEVSEVALDEPGIKIQFDEIYHRTIEKRKV